MSDYNRYQNTVLELQKGYVKDQDKQLTNITQAKNWPSLFCEQ